MSAITEGSGNGSATRANQSNESANANGVQLNNNASNITTTTIDEPRPTRSRRPADVALLQQRMKSWQPLLDPKWVIASYFLIGIVFIPVGESTKILNGEIQMCIYFESSNILINHNRHRITQPIQQSHRA